MRATKDSGVDWLGEIPVDWEVKRFRHVFRESSEVNGRKPVGQMLSISSYHGVQVKEYASENLQRDDDQLETYRVVRPNQLAVNTMWLNHGGLGVSEITGHMSPAYRAYTIDGSFHPKYVHHLMRSKIYVIGYTGLLTGIRPNSLQMSRENLMGFPILCPPMDEQRRIADFLDRETAKIDTLIAKQEHLITTLKERQQAVISRTVTRGFTQDISLRDSGHPWIGNIPDHWRTTSLRRLARIYSGGTPDRNNPGFWLDGTVPWLNSGAVNSWAIFEASEFVTVEAFASSSAKWVPEKSVVMGLAGQGKTKGTVARLEIRSTTNQSMAAIVPSRELDYRYLHLWLSANYQSIRNLAGGDKRDGLNLEHVSSIGIPIPPIQEQNDISDFLDKEVSLAKELTTKAMEMIGLLDERRQALISAAVTGKLEVTDGYS